MSELDLTREPDALNLLGEVKVKWLREENERLKRQVEVWKRKDNSFLKARAERDGLIQAGDKLVELLIPCECYDEPTLCATDHPHEVTCDQCKARAAWEAAKGQA